MACQISYERLNKLFFDSVAYDAKYKSYREMANSIFSMALTEESKVTALWYMGLLYNNAIGMDKEIRTEDLPRAVSAVAADKIGNESVDFIELYKKVQAVFAPQAADEADLSGGISTTSDIKTKPTYEKTWDLTNQKSIGKKVDVKINAKNVVDKLIPINGKFLHMGMGGRFFVLAKVGNSTLPFYMSSEGNSGKQQGEWFPFFGISKGGWINKGGVDEMSKGYGIKEIQDIQNTLNDNIKFGEASSLISIEGKVSDNNGVFFNISDYISFTSGGSDSWSTNDKTVTEKLGISFDSKGKDIREIFENSFNAWKTKYDAELATSKGKPEVKGETPTEKSLSEQNREIYTKVKDENKTRAVKGKYAYYIARDGSSNPSVTNLGVIAVFSEKGFKVKGKDGKLSEWYNYSYTKDRSKNPYYMFSDNNYVKEEVSTKEPVVEEKPLTLKDKINAEFNKIKGSTAAEFDKIFDKIHNLTKDNPELGTESQIKVFEKLKEIITAAVKKKVLGEVYRARISTILNEYTQENTVGAIDYGEVEGVGKDMYVIRQLDGTLIHAFFDVTANKYYKVFLAEGSADMSEEYSIQDTDYVTPIYYRKETRVNSDEKGKTIIRRGLATNGIDFSGTRLKPELTDWNQRNINILRKNLKEGSLLNQITITADRRRTRLNAARTRKYGIEWEHNLRPDQIKALNENPDLPAVAFLLQKSGVQFTMANKYPVAVSKDEAYQPGELFDYITSLDNIGFVYANGTVRPVDWNNVQDLALLSKTLKIRKTSRSELVEATPADIQRYKEAVTKVRKLKEEIADSINDDETYQLTDQQIRSHFSILNPTYMWKNDPRSARNENDTIPLEKIKDELSKFSSTVTANVGKKTLGGRISGITTEEIVGVVRNINGKLEFEDTLGENKVVLDENNQPLEGGIKNLFLREGLDEGRILGILNKESREYAYLYRTSTEGWSVRPMIATTYINSNLDKVSFISSLSALAENLPAYNQESAPMFASMLNSFSETGWGFNTYDGLIANLDYREAVTKKNTTRKDVFYISVRPDSNYAYFAGLGDKKTIARFELDFDYTSSLLDLKQLAKALKLTYNPTGSVADKISFGKELKRALESQLTDTQELERIIQNPSKSSPFEQSLSSLVNQYNDASKSLHEQVQKETQKHQKHIEKGEAPYLNTEKSSLEYLLFNKLGNPNTFKIRDNSVKSNPLQKFRVFDKKVGGELEGVGAEIQLNFANPGVINPNVTQTVVADIPPASREAVVPPSTRKTLKRNNIDKEFKLVSSLKGLKIIGDEKWNAQIEDALRILGKLYKINESDVSDLDVTGTALAYYQDKVITLNNKLKVGGIVYHEVFHAIFRTAISNEKRTELLANAAILYGAPKEDFKGVYLEHEGKKVYVDEFRQNRRYMGLSDGFTLNLMYEEFLADGFRDYKLNKKEPANAFIRMFYSAIDALIKLFTSKKYEAAKSINQFYEEIDKGMYADKIGDELVSYPRAYELINVPTHIVINEVDNEPAVQFSQVSVEVHDQLKNRVLHELFNRASDIVNDRARFDNVYDEVTKDLIQEYNLERYFNEDNEKLKQQITDKYGSNFRAMRYMLGSLHREDVREKFYLKNLTGDPENDNKIEEGDESIQQSLESFETFRDDVFKEYTTIEVDASNYSNIDDEDEREKGDIDEENPNNLDSNDPSEIGENFRDDGILTFNPYNGDKNFQKLLRYVKYTYTDPILGVKFTKMVNSRTIINSIRKLVLNKPFDNKLPAIQEHIELLQRNVDEFYADQNLINDLQGEIPMDMVKIEDDYNQLSAVMQFITEKAGLDENYMPTREAGIPFLNMFHHVFNYSSAEIDAINVNVETEIGEDNTYGSVYTKVELLKKTEINKAREDFKTNVNVSIDNLKEVPAVVSQLKDVYDGEYTIPEDEDELKAMTSAIYRITALAQLDVPRYLIEYGIAADMYKTYTDPNKIPAYLKSIVEPNKEFYNESKYIDIKTFLSNIKGVYDNIDSSTVDKKVAKLVASYVPSIPLLLQYDTASYDIIVRNLDGKPISKVIPNVPSVEILNQVKNKGLEKTLIRIHGRDLLNFFSDNPFFSSVLEGWEYDPNDTSEEGIEKNRKALFLDQLKISVSGGLTQQTFGRSKKSTFKSLGDKSYALSLLGLFANRKRRKISGQETLTTFTRPITQLEATSTQFNVTGLYQSYHVKGKLNNKLIVDSFTKALSQEWNRVKKEWSERHDRKPRWEDFNAKTIISTEDIAEYNVQYGTVITDDPTLRAYRFSNSNDFFIRNQTTKLIGELLEKNARIGQLSFETALNQLMPDSTETVGEILAQELVQYGTDTYNDMVDYFSSVGITPDDIPEFIKVDTAKRNEFNNLEIENVEITKRKGAKEGEAKGSVIETETEKNRDLFLEDFLYNFWFNSMFVNQLFDGDTAIGVSNIITYFKRQKAGVAAGPNYRNYSLANEEEDVTVTATLQELFGYLNDQDKEAPVSANPENGSAVSWADGQGFTTLQRRIKKFAKSGLLTDSLKEALLYARAGYLTRSEQEVLEAHGIVLNSDKPVIAGPYDYVKDSEHIILRGDVSTIRPDDVPIVLDLYNQLDSVDKTALGGIDEYKSILKEIHKYFTPRPDSVLLHTLLNSMEYHSVDVVTDKSARKKGNPPPTLVNIAALDDFSQDNHPVVNIYGEDVPMMEDGYINLEYSKIAVPNELVYDQVLTAAATEAVGDPIQPKIMLPAQLDGAKFKHIKKEVTELRKIEAEITTARQEIVERLFNNGKTDPSGLLSKVIQSGLSTQGASTNALKLFSIDPKTGKNRYNLNLPVHGKAPLYYFFSMFNNNLFGPKVAGEKYYHVSGLGKKLIFDKATGEQVSEEALKRNPREYLLNRDKYEYRYPTVKIEDDKIVVECFIPRKLGQTPEDTAFFEKLYADYLLGMRIPTELKRSMVVIKVIGYLDAAYSNSIIVPPQVHKWAGSDLDIDALYTQSYAYYRNSLRELVKYGDLEPYTELGLTEDQASFVEFLHYISEDLGFKELLDLERDRIKSNTEYKIESLANGAGLFGINIRQFFEASEAMNKEDMESELGVDPKELKTKLRRLLDRKSVDVGGQKKMKIGKNDAEVLKLLNRLTAVVNVLNEFEIFGKNKQITPENFKAYVKKNGNPTTPNLHNRALKLKTDILADPIVYDTFTRNFSADDAIKEYKDSAALLEGLSESSKIKTANMFTPQTVARVRKLNKNAKQMVSGNASNAKTITILATAKAKISDKYTFNFQRMEQGKFKKKTTNEFVESGPINTSNSIGFATDDGKNQFAGILNLFINNSGIMNYMYALGYDTQFAKLIHSVDSVNEVINEFLITSDPGYVTPGKAPFSFTTTLNQALSVLINQNEKALLKAGLLTKSDTGKKDDYMIDKDAFTINFTSVSNVIENRLPSSMGISIVDKKGNILNNELASIVTLHFYNQMLKLSNDISFKLGPISDLLKKLRPSWSAISKIKDSVKFVEDNDVFEGNNIRSIYKAYPVLKTLSKESLNFMLDTSKKILLDQTYLFRGITNLFKADRELTEDEVVVELKSIMGLQVLRQYVNAEMNSLSKDDDSNIAKMIRMLNNAFTSEYWLNENAPQELKLLKKKFSDNEFLKSLSSKPALRESKRGKDNINVIVSNLGNKVTPESQERLINDFYFLLSYPDSQVQEAAINIAIHGIVRDGGMAKQEGYLKVIAPEMFKRLSTQLDRVQEIFYNLDTDKKKIDTPEKYIKDLNEGLSTMFDEKVTIDAFMKAILNKLVSSITYDVTSDPRLKMSFWEGNADFPNKGAFSDIDLTDFAKILDTIIPKNKQFVYTRVKEKVVPYQGVRKSEEGKSSKSKFELWKADTNSELFFDLTNLNALNNIEQVARVLKRQGIYKTDEGYSFPLYKVNNYEGGQVFILEELDGRPITESFFRNLFNSYKSKSELIELLKGSTAKYKVYKRQGLDRISPNGLTSAVATELNEAANGIRSTSSTRVKATALPAEVVNIENAKTLLVSDPNQVNDIKDNKFTVNGKELYVFSTTATYKFALNRSGAISIYKRGKGSFFMIYNQAKEESNDKEVQYLMNKLGFGSITDFFASDSLTKAAILPKPGSVNQFTLLNYNVNERKVEGVAPDITQPVNETTSTTQPSTSSVIQKAVADIPQNKVSGIESYGSLVTANDAVIKALGLNPHSIDMIQAGFRTRTTRSEKEMEKYGVKVGDIIKHFGKSADGTTKNILAKVTAVHPKGTPGFKGTWAKEGWKASDVNVIDRFKDGAAAIEFEVINASETSTEPTSSSDIKVVAPDYGVVQVSTSVDETFNNELVNAIQDNIENNAYVENGSGTANLMFSYGWQWKGNNTKTATGKVLKVQPAQVDYKANGKLTPVKSPYFYDSKYNDGTLVPNIKELDFLKRHIEKTLGKDMSNYDVALCNIYTKGTDLFRHTDIDESDTAKGYPVVVYVLGNQHKVRIDDNGGKRSMGAMVNPKTLDLKNGDIYTFGMDGKGRFEAVHDVVKTEKTDDSFPPITLPDGTITSKYTITFTFRRAADLEPGMPSTPAKLGPAAETKITKMLSNLGEKNFNNVLERYKTEEGLNDALIVDTYSYDEKDGYEDTTKLTFKTLQKYLQFNKYFFDPIDLDYLNDDDYKASTLEELFAKLMPFITEVNPSLVYEGIQEIQFPTEAPVKTQPAVTETTIEYTPTGKQRQTYTIKGNQVFNKAGQEVFKEDSVDRNKIFANLAVQQDRAVVVEHKGAKYIVNNKNQIISGTTGKMMQWDENNGDRKAIVTSAQEKFPSQKKQDDDDVTDNNIFNC